MKFINSIFLGVKASIYDDKISIEIFVCWSNPLFVHHCENAYGVLEYNKSWYFYITKEKEKQII